LNRTRWGPGRHFPCRDELHATASEPVGSKRALVITLDAVSIAEAVAATAEIHHNHSSQIAGYLSQPTCSVQTESLTFAPPAAAEQRAPQSTSGINT